MTFWKHRPWCASAHGSLISKTPNLKKHIYFLKTWTYWQICSHNNVGLIESTLLLPRRGFLCVCVFVGKKNLFGWGKAALQETAESTTTEQSPPWKSYGTMTLLLITVGRNSLKESNPAREKAETRSHRQQSKLPELRQSRKSVQE